MTEEQAQDFINKVKGKKIRWRGWDKESYVISDGTFGTFTKAINHYQFTGICSWFPKGCLFSIGEGLNENNWTLCEDLIDMAPNGAWRTRTLNTIEGDDSMIDNISKPHECNCKWNDVLRYGCRCGGI